MLSLTTKNYNLHYTLVLNPQLSVAVIAPAKEQVAVPTSDVPPLVVNNPPEIRNPMFDTMKPADAVTWR